MRRSALAVLPLVALGLSLARAGDEPARESKEKDDAHATTLAALEKELEPVRWRQDEESLAKKKVIVGKLRALADSAKGTKTGLAALVDICGQNGEGCGAAADAIVEGYADSKDLAPALGTASRAWYSDGGKYDVSRVEAGLKKVIEKSPHANVKAAAMLALAQWFMGVEKAGKAKRLEACDLLDKIQKDFKDAPCAKEAAEYASFHTREIVEKERKVEPRPASDFAVGKTAPDFEAEDESGKTFKLSDYRGKVVALDFWGFW